MVRKQVLGQLLGQGRAALDNTACAGVFDHGAEGADEINAEMAEKPPVFCRQGGLYQTVRYFFQRHAVIEHNAPAADLVAEPVQERDRKIIRGFPIGISCCLNGRLSESQKHDKPDQAECQAVRAEFGKAAPDALGAKAA